MTADWGAAAQKGQVIGAQRAHRPELCRPRTSQCWDEHGQPNQVSAVRGTHPREHTREVIAHRIRRELERGRDLLVGVAERHMLDELSLALGEALAAAA